MAEAPTPPPTTPRPPAWPGEPRPLGPGGPSGERRRELLLWLLLLLLVAVIATANALFVPPAPDGDDAGPADQMGLVFQAKYLVGVHDLFEELSAVVGEAALERQLAPLVGTLDGLAPGPAQRLALVPVYFQLGAEDRGRAVLADLRAQGLDPPLVFEVEAVAGLYEEPPVAPDEVTRASLRERYGWFAELALSRAADGVEPVGDPVADARGVALAVLALFLVGLGALLAGAVLSILAFIGWSQGRLRSAYADGAGRLATPRLTYLETLIVFLLALQLVGVVAGAVAGATDSLWPLLLNWLALPVVLWPAVRGADAAELRSALGWHRGSGVLREAAAGLVAYVAAMPLLAFGLVATVVLAGFVEQPPYHPVIDWIRGPSLVDLAMVYLLAALWAPLVEETVFRGAFYHYLRGRWRPLVSALLVSLLFAVIHPQGVVGLPFLICLAVALALTREWRGSVIASVVMHLVHNGLAVTFMVWTLS